MFSLLIHRVLSGGNSTGHQIIWLCSTDIQHNFDIRWRDPGAVPTAFLGYYTRFRVDQTVADAIRGWPITLSGMTLQTFLVSLSRYSVLVILKVTSARSAAWTCDVAVCADINADIGGNETRDVGDLSGGRGIFWTAGDKVMNVICSEYPLVSGVTGYWYGPHAELDMEVWSRFPAAVHSGVDLAMSFSWQGLSVPGGGSVARWAIFHSGEFSVRDTPQLTVDIDIPMTTSGGSLLVNVTLTGAWPMSVFVAPGDDSAAILRAAENLTSGLHQISVSMKWAPGSHSVWFYAVDEEGFVSEGEWLLVLVLHNATPTEAQSPTLTQSPVESQSPAPYPSPIPWAWPLAWSYAPTIDRNFDIGWRSNDTLIQTCFLGYSAIVQVGSEESEIRSDEAVEIEALRLETKLVQLVPSAVLLVYKLRNWETAPISCSVAVYADTAIGTNDLHFVGHLPAQQGLYWQGRYEGVEYRLNVVGRHYPLVTGISTYWFGLDAETEENIWNETESPWYSGYHVGIAFAWKDVVVPGDSPQYVSALFRSGAYVADQPTIGDIKLPGVVFVEVHGSFSLDIPISDFIPDTLMSIFASVDGDISDLTLIGANLTTGTYPVSIDISAFGLAHGVHDISLFVVNSAGLISDPLTFAIEVVPGQTPQPLAWQWNTSADHNFDIQWADGGGIPTAIRGYSTRLRVGDVVEDALQGRPTSASSVFLETALTQLSKCAILVTFRIANHWNITHVADVAVFAGVHVGGDKQRAIGGLPDGAGVFWGGNISWHLYRMNVIGRGSPLVSDITGYWYGPWSTMASEIWSISPTPDNPDDDLAMSISWQGVTLLPGASTQLSAIFQSGDVSQRDRPQMDVTVNGLTGNITVVGTSAISVWVLVDDDRFSLRQLLSEVPAGLHPVILDLKLPEGVHRLTFIAVDEFGFVSNRVVIDVEAGPDATSTPARSHPPSQSARPPATLVPIPFPLVWFWAAAEQCNFDIRWRNGAATIQSCYGGYKSVLQVGSNRTRPIGDEPVTVSEISMRSSVISLCPNTLLLVYTLRNDSGAPASADVAVWTNAVVGSNDGPDLNHLPDGAGFFWEGEFQDARYRMNLIGRLSPLVSGISTYWFGHSAQVEQNLWVQKDNIPVYGNDFGIAFSWQRVAVQFAATAQVSAIFRSGPYLTERPMIGAVVAPLTVFVNEAFVVQLTISDQSPMDVLVLFDRDLAAISKVAEGITSGTQQLTVGVQGLAPGVHEVEFYVVNALGGIAESTSAVVEVVVKAPSLATVERTQTGTTTGESTSRPPTNTQKGKLGPAEVAGIIVGVLAVIVTAIIIIIKVKWKKRSPDWDFLEKPVIESEFESFTGQTPAWVP
jgi:hypothetical protein